MTYGLRHHEVSVISPHHPLPITHHGLLVPRDFEAEQFHGFVRADGGFCASQRQLLIQCGHSFNARQEDRPALSGHQDDAVSLRIELRSGAHRLAGTQHVHGDRQAGHLLQPHRRKTGIPGGRANGIVNDLKSPRCMFGGDGADATPQLAGSFQADEHSGRKKRVGQFPEEKRGGGDDPMFGQKDLNGGSRQVNEGMGHIVMG